jgi:putative transposase
MINSKEVQFEEVITRRAYTWEISKVTADILRQELTVVSAVPINSAISTALTGFITSLESLTDDKKNQITFRLKVVKFLKKCGINRGQRKEINSALKKLKINVDKNEKLPSASTAMNWMRLWELSGSNPASLLSKHFNKSRSKQFSNLVENLITKVLKEHYFIRERPPLSNAEVILITQLNRLQAQSKITESEANVSISTLRRRVNEVDPYVRDVHRYGAAYARNKWRYSLSGSGSSRALQQLEIDHTILDILVISDTNGMPLGRPVITIIVDSYSKYLVGFYISFAGAGLSAVLNAMKIGIMSKDSFTCHADYLENPWLGYGIGEMYVVDNGLEFHSKQFVYAALELNTDIQYCPVRQPWLKPSVERFFLDLGYALPNSGKILKPVANVLPINPISTARISFSELSRGLIKYFVDVYPFKVNSRTLVRPFDLFQESFEKLPPPMLPTSFESIGIIAAHSTTLTVGNEGIVMPGLRFNSKELQSVRRQISDRYKTMIKFDPEDLGYAYVQHPKSLDWLYVPNTNPNYANGLSMAQHRAIRAHQKKFNIEGDYIQSHIRAKAELIEMWNSLSGGKRLKRDTKNALLYQGLSSTKSLQISTNDAIASSEKQLILPDELKINDRPIPTFEAFIND